MYWYKYLYADKKVHHINRLKYKIAHGMSHKGVYLIHLPEGKQALPEVIPSILLRQSHYPRETLRIIGIGSSKWAALELVRQMIDEVYREQGNFLLETYLKLEKEPFSEHEVTGL